MFRVFLVCLSFVATASAQNGCILIDSDGDSVPDCADICKHDAEIHTVNFGDFTNISLDNGADDHGQEQAIFVVNDKGDGVTQLINSKPAIMFGRDFIRGLDFDGSFNIDDGDDDYVGFIFGYQNDSSFYVISWKQSDQEQFQCHDDSVAKAGLHLKRVHSSTGPSCELENALWRSTDTTDQATLLWHDPQMIGWNASTTYTMQLVHRPKIGLIHFRFLSGGEIVVESGEQFDHNIKGGFVGLYTQSQGGITWSDLKYSCNDDSVSPPEFDYLFRHHITGLSPYPEGLHSIFDDY